MIFYLWAMLIVSYAISDVFQWFLLPFSLCRPFKNCPGDWWRRPFPPPFPGQWLDWVVDVSSESFRQLGWNIKRQVTWEGNSHFYSTLQQMYPIYCFILLLNDWIWSNCTIWQIFICKMWFIQSDTFRMIFMPSVKIV